MSRRNFAKKFVAYSMAFAVAFSTITVSPVFVKEAKAAVDYSVTITGTSGHQIANGKAILDNTSVKSNVKQDTIATTAVFNSVNDLAETVGMKDNMINPGLTYGEVKLPDPSSTPDPKQKSSVTLKYDEYELAETGLDKGAASNTDVHNVIVGKDKVTLSAKENGDYSWYQLVKGEGKLERTGVALKDSDKTTDETITFNYYVFDQVENTGDEYSLDTVTSDELGLYVAVNNTLGSTTSADNYKLFQVVEDSTLEAKAEEDDYFAKENESVKLVVNATSNKSNIKYTWKKGATVLAETSNVYTIDKVDGTTRGLYTCVVNDGVKEKVVGPIKVANYTATAEPQKSETDSSTSAVSDSIKYTSVVKCLVDLSQGQTGVNSISGGKVTLTSCVPKSDDYVYVWNVPTSVMSEADVVNYSAGNNSITIQDDLKDTNYFTNRKPYKCYVLNKDEYAEAFSTELIAVGNAKTDIEKFKANSDLRTKEAAKMTGDGSTHYLGDIEKLALFEETFYLLDAADKVISSENVVKKIGESVKAEAPVVTTASGVNTIYTDNISPDADVDTTGTKVTLFNKANTIDEEGKEFEKSAVTKADFGTKRFVVANDAKNATSDMTTVNKASEVFIPEMNYYNTDGTVNTSVTKFNYDGLKRSTTYNVVAEKFVNIVYASDLTLSADDVTAKVGSKVTLKANATSKLPVEYEWIDVNDVKAGSTVGTAIQADTKDHSMTKEFAVLADDIYKPEKDVNENGVIDANEKEANYVLCTAYNGVERKTVKIKINQLGGFTYVDKDNKVHTSVENVGDADRTFTVLALEGKDFTLTANVTPSEGTELTYAWYQNTVGGNVLSTEKTFTTKEATLVNVPATGTTGAKKYVCVVTEKDAPGSAMNFTYNVFKTGISEKDITIKKIEPQKYTGKAIEPELTVSLATGFVGDLVAGTDYTAVYENNINTGIARVTVTLTDKIDKTAKGITAETTFAIDRADNEVKLADVTVNVGGNVKPVVTDKANATMTIKYYADKELTKEVTEAAVKAKAGTYYAQATAQATTNYNAAKSNVATITVKGLGTTSKLSVTKRTSTTMTVSYAKVANAAGYRIYVKNVKTNYAWKVVKETTALTYKVTGLPAGYYTAVAVRAYDANKVLAPKYASVTKRTAPGTTSKVTITTSKNAAKLTWKKVTGATHYRVYVKKAGKWTALTTTKSNTFTKTGLKRRTTYTFAVRAYNSTDKLWADKYVAKSAKTK